MRFFAMASTVLSSLALVSAAAAPAPGVTVGTSVARDLILSSRIAQDSNINIASRQDTDQSCVVDCITAAVKSNTSAASCASATSSSELQSCVCKNKGLMSDISTCVKRDCPSSSSLVSQMCSVDVSSDSSTSSSGSSSSSGSGSSGSDAGVKLSSGSALSIAAGAAFIALVM